MLKPPQSTNKHNKCYINCVESIYINLWSSMSYVYPDLDPKDFYDTVCAFFTVCRLRFQRNSVGHRASTLFTLLWPLSTQLVKNIEKPCSTLLQYCKSSKRWSTCVDYILWTESSELEAITSFINGATKCNSHTHSSCRSLSFRLQCLSHGEQQRHSTPTAIVAMLYIYT